MAAHMAAEHRLARDASLRINCGMHGGSIAWHACLASNQQLHTWRQHRLAHGASLRITYCRQCSAVWHVMPRFKVNSCANGSSVTWLVMPHSHIKGCAHGGSIAWHAVPRVESTAARMAAASLGTWYLALHQVLHACSIAWRVMSGIRPWAERMVAALLGTWSLVSYQVLHTMQHRLACDASL